MWIGWGRDVDLMKAECGLVGGGMWIRLEEECRLVGAGCGFFGLGGGWMAAGCGFQGCGCGFVGAVCGLAGGGCKLTGEWDMDRCN